MQCDQKPEIEPQRVDFPSASWKPSSALPIRPFLDNFWFAGNRGVSHDKVRFPSTNSPESMIAPTRQSSPNATIQDFL